MSRLDELIAELCPVGVEYKKLGDVISVERGKRVVREQLPSIGKYFVYQNSLTPLGYSNEYNYSHDTTFIIGAGAAGEIGYSCDDFWAADDCYPLVCSDNYNDRFLYHLMLSRMSYISSQVRKGSIPRLSRLVIENMRIPVPPLPVQQEIVRILDHFTEITAELQKQLDAEIAARQKQYEYYRDNLLLSHETTEYTVQDLIDLKMIDEPMDGNHGELHPKKADYVSSGVPFIMANNLVNGSLDYDNCAFITEKQAATLRKGFAKPGDVLLTHKGTIGRTAIVPESFSSIVLTPQVTYYRIKKGIDNRYLKHYFDSAPFQAQITDIAGLGGTRAYIGITAQRALRIRMPSLEDQRDISLKLECFDKLYNNLTSGLPAEIAARQKQYEYYRDKLLNFKEKGA